MVLAWSANKDDKNVERDSKCLPLKHNHTTMMNATIYNIAHPETSLPGLPISLLRNT